MVSTESARGTSPGTLEAAEMSRRNPCLTTEYTQGSGRAELEEEWDGSKQATGR